MPSDSIFLPLTERLVVCGGGAGLHHCFPSDLIAMMNKGFRESLTLRSLINLCIACKQRPSAPMLAFALQNSIPSLVGLPMDNPDPGFYVDIAKRFFDPEPVTFQERVTFYRSVHHYNGKDDFFPFRSVDLDSSIGPFWPTAMDFYVENTLSGMSETLLATQKGRAFVKEAMLEWRKVHERQPDHIRFIDHILRILDHGMVLRRRRVLPGLLHDCLNCVYFDKDEHL
jgi:hypothetical protein